jgi:tetratricopeptide (TPR) repeat protein
VFAEFVEAGSLRDWIMTRQLYRGGEEVALARILDIAIQTAWALDYAHRRQLVHQDVKPGNVMMTSDGTAKLTDFGLTRAARAATHDAQQHAVAEYAGGTPAYWSPEQEKRLDVTLAADVWSWALSILEMFTGGFILKSGAQAKAHLAAFRQRALLKVRGLPKMPDSLYEILGTCFRSDPQNRPSDLGTVAHQLIDIYNSVHGDNYGRLAPDTGLVAADSLNNRAISLLDLGQKDKALSLLTKALAIDPVHPEATFNRALILYREGKRSATNVVAKLEAILAANMGSWNVDCLLARMCIEVGDKTKAMNAIARAESKIASESERAQLGGIKSAVTAGPLKALFGKNRQPFVLAIPISTADHAFDYQKMLRLVKKAEVAYTERRHYDVQRYLEQLRLLPGFARHPEVRQLFKKMRVSEPS